MKNENRSKTLRVFILVLAALLAISLLALAGTMIYRHFIRSQDTTAVASDNVITPEKTASGSAIRATPLAATRSLVVDQAQGKDVTLKINNDHPKDGAAFQAKNMFPGDRETKTYDLEISYKGTVTVLFRADIPSGYEKLAEVLRCRVEIDGQRRYDGLMRDMPVIEYTVTSEGKTTDTIKYVLTAYLETSVGNEYQNKQLVADFVWWVDETFSKPTDPGDEPPAPPELEKGDHYSYIIGYTDGLVRPEAKITRAEAATIFFRMLTEDSRAYYWCKVNPYYDVKPDDWFNNAISTLTNAGILSGRPGNCFDPSAEITRAEFAAIIARFFAEDVEVTQDYFSDISGHWANYEINLAYALGYLQGYPDGTFRPDQSITRAEVMALMNRVLDRAPHKDHLLEGMIQWPDNQDRDMWYYEDVQEATNSHAYVMQEADDGTLYEVWTELLENRDWAALEKLWSEHNSSPSPGEPIGIMLMQGDMGVYLAGEEDAQIPVESLSLVAEQDGGLSILFSDVNVLFDRRAVTSILENTDASQVSVSVQAASAARLNEAQQKALSRLSLSRVISASVNSGAVSTFGGGQATFYVPFRIPAGAEDSTYSVLYVAEDGTLEYVDSYYLDGQIVFFAEHFSDYVIVRDLDRSVLAQGQLVDPSATGLLWWLLAVPVVVLSAVLIRRKRRKRHETS